VKYIKLMEPKKQKRAYSGGTV